MVREQIVKQNEELIKASEVLKNALMWTADAKAGGSLSSVAYDALSDIECSLSAANLELSDALAALRVLQAEFGY